MSECSSWCCYELAYLSHEPLGCLMATYDVSRGSRWMQGQRVRCEVCILSTAVHGVFVEYLLLLSGTVLGMDPYVICAQPAPMDILPT